MPCAGIGQRTIRLRVLHDVRERVRGALRLRGSVVRTASYSRAHPISPVPTILEILREEPEDRAMANFDFEATIASLAAVAITGFYWTTLIDVVVR